MFIVFDIGNFHIDTSVVQGVAYMLEQAIFLIVEFRRLAVEKIAGRRIRISNMAIADDMFLHQS